MDRQRADGVSLMEELTSAQRKAIKTALLIFKRFWNATPDTADEDVEADRLIDAVKELAELMEEPS